MGFVSVIIIFYQISATDGRYALRLLNGVFMKHFMPVPECICYSELLKMPEISLKSCLCFQLDF